MINFSTVTQEVKDFFDFEGNQFVIISNQPSKDILCPTLSSACNCCQLLNEWGYYFEIYDTDFTEYRLFKTDNVYRLEKVPVIRWKFKSLKGVSDEH